MSRAKRKAMSLPVVPAPQSSGADKELEPDDPMQLEGVFVPEGELAVMAEAMVEEYARMGVPEAEIFHFFRQSFFTGTHRFFRTYGEASTRAMIRRVLARTGVLHCRVETPGDGGSHV